MYGPERTGRGLVLESSFPAIERHLPSGLRPASEAKADMREMAKGLVAEVAGLMSLWAKASSLFARCFLASVRPAPWCLCSA